MKLILVAWFFLVLAYIVIVLYFTKKEVIITSYEISLFILLGLQLIVVNMVLLK